MGMGLRRLGSAGRPGSFRLRPFLLEGPPVKRICLLAIAWIACVLGFVGVIIPVLPTTPLLLLATFLFAKASPRCQAWIERTRIYQSYVVPFKENGGIKLGAKVRILVVSYALIGASAFFVRKPTVWIILSCCCLFLLWLVVFRIPTLGPDGVARHAFSRKVVEPKAGRVVIPEVDSAE